MVKLKHIGLWSKLGGIFPNPRHLKMSSLDPEETEKLAQYVQNSPLVINTHRNPLSTTPSLIEQGVELGLGLRSDGTWLYPEGFAYYVRQGVAVPLNFLSHVREKDYQPPIDPTDYEAVTEDFGHSWIWWSLLHSRLTWHLPLSCLLFILQYPARQLLWPLRAIVKVR